MVRRLWPWLCVLALVACKEDGAADDPASTDVAVAEEETDGEELVGSLTVGVKLRTLSGVNLRSEPSTKSKVLGVLPAGTEVTVSKSMPQGGFYKVKAGSKEGWCSGKYLTLVAVPDPDDEETPGATACQKELSARGISFKTRKARGVEDAVMVTGPVGGVLFASGKTTTPAADPVACEFVKTMEAMGKVLKSRGFVRVGTLGSYCFRCCCAWSPSNDCRDMNDPEPQCDNGFSNHSWGRAVDIRYLVKADGTVYDVNNPKHFVISSSGDTCGAGLDAQKGISAEMYGAACALVDKGILLNFLTPNHNGDHRNHFHVDVGEKGPVSKTFATSVD